MNKRKVVARLTVTREIGNVTIIEVHQDATFHEFYRIFTQVGRRRSTKQLVRTASRNEGLQPWYAAHRMQPGLEVLAAKWLDRKGLSVKLRIIKKRSYRRLINVAANELGPLPVIRNPFPVKNPSAGILLLLPTKRVSEGVRS
jgi:hypothetical protein